MPLFVILHDLQFQFHVDEPSSDPVQFDLIVPYTDILIVYLVPSHRKKLADRPLVKPPVLHGQFPGQSHLSKPGDTLRVQVAGIPVLHPRDHDPASVGCEDCLLRVEINPVIHALIRLGNKSSGLGIVLPDQAESPVAVVIFQSVRQHIHRAGQDNLFAIQFKQVRTFPHSSDPVPVDRKLFLEFPVVGILCRKQQDLSALLFFPDHRGSQKPVRIVRITVMQHFLLFFQGIAHRSSLKCSVFILPYAGIPEVVSAALLRQVLKGKNGVARVLRVILTISESNALCLHLPVPVADLHLPAYAGVHEHMRAVLHHQRPSGKAAIPVIGHVRCQCGRHVFPMQKVPAHGMSPMHRPPV